MCAVILHWQRDTVYMHEKGIDIENRANAMASKFTRVLQLATLCHVGSESAGGIEYTLAMPEAEPL